LCIKNRKLRGTSEVGGGTSEVLIIASEELI